MKTKPFSISELEEQAKEYIKEKYAYDRMTDAEFNMAINEYENLLKALNWIKNHREITKMKLTWNK